MNVLPGMSALGVRLNIDDVERAYDTASYGTDCWQVFWEVVDIRALGTALPFEGDTRATPSSGSEYVNCICVQERSVRNKELPRVWLLAEGLARVG